MSPAVRRITTLLAVVTVVAACSGDAEPTTTSAAAFPSSTTTTIDVEVCDDLAEEAVGWLEDLVAELDGIRYEVLVDRTQWPDGLVRLDEEGGALQAESDAAGCDEGLIRGAVVAAAAGMEADGATARLLLELLAPGP